MLVFLWFVGLSFLLVAVIFDSPALDYRLVLVGAVLPLPEALIGGPWLLHTLLGAVGVFALVAVTGRGRRLFQRRWVGLPIGIFVHLVLDGTWAEPELFWWPFLGGSLGDGPIPELDRGLGVIVMMEVIGAGALVVAVRRFGLDRPVARRRFLATGQLLRGPVSGVG